MTRSMVRWLGPLIASMSIVAMVGKSASAQGRKEAFEDWSLERLRTGFSLVYRAFASQGDAIKTAEFGFVCDRAGKIGATIIPFEGTYYNHQDEIPVLIEFSGQPAGPHLAQQWANGYKYLFLDKRDQVDDLVRYLKAAQVAGEEAVEVFFAGDFDGRADILKIAVGLSDFSKGFSGFEAACAKVSR